MTYHILSTSGRTNLPTHFRHAASTGPRILWLRAAIYAKLAPSHSE